VAVEIADAEAARGIGGAELVIGNLKFVPAVRGTDNGRIQNVGGVRYNHRRLAPERNVVMKLRQEARFAAQVEILPVHAEECVPGNLHILPPDPACMVGRGFAPVHIKILFMIMAKEAVTWRIREHEVVPGAETRARPAILPGHGMAVGDKCVALNHRVSADVGADAVTIALPFIMVDEIPRDEDVFWAGSRVPMIPALYRNIISCDLDSGMSPG